MKNFCDIVPQWNGWAYVIDGVQSASCYHTYDLAMDAAKAELAKSGMANRKVFRRQEINGQMKPLPIVHQIVPVTSVHSGLR